MVLAAPTRLLRSRSLVGRRSSMVRAATSPVAKGAMFGQDLFYLVPRDEIARALMVML
jgi:hypothetical protein